MEPLTGIPAFGWALALVYVVTAAFVAGSLWWRSPGSRVLGFLVVPFAVGAVGVALLAILFPSDTWSLLGDVGDRRAAVAAACAVVLVGAAVADFLVVRIAGLAAHALGRLRRAGDIALALTLSAATAVALVGIVWIEGRTVPSDALSPSASGRATVVADFELPGQPMDIVFRRENEGYISYGDGRIARFVLSQSGTQLDLAIVASGLESPRGIAVVGDALIVADLGPLPCEQRFPCKGENVNASSLDEGERRILRESNGRLLAFDIGSDGSLGGRQVIRDRLPVANTDHGVNAVTAGEDGRVYVSIGHVDRLGTSSLTATDRERPNFELLGTVLSLRPDGSDLRVVARGLRNVYDLALDDTGRLYGVDNSGPTMRGWRREEVLEIRPGADFGYPYDGTFAPYTRRTEPPLWVLDTAGSAGVESIPRAGGSTLVVGSCNDVYSVELSVVGTTIAARGYAVAQHLLSVPGCVTAVERVDNGRLAMTLFTFGGPPRLYLVDLEK